MVVAPRDDGVTATVIAIVLAAGRSSRTGLQHKLLAKDAAGRSMIARTLGAVTASKVCSVAVILSPDRDDIVCAVEACRLPVTQLFSPDFKLGLSASLRVGLAWAEAQKAEGALICLGDMPLVSTDVINALIEEFYRTTVDVVLPEYQGRIGNPVLWNSRCFAALSTLSGDRGGRALLSSPALQKAMVQSEETVLVDFDTPEMLQWFATL
ncbi:nucleotidyltransferase family protein [Acetobacter sp.]|uniref:nucleotidyltransferase family protein n=1 Tax=Acetobacter sp. TaxID=440 RepID=UPI0039ECA5A5